MSHPLSVPIHIALNMNEAALVVIPEPERSQLRHSVAAIAAVYPTYWAVDNIYPKTLTETGSEERIIRYSGASALGSQGKTDILQQTPLFILSGLEADLHIVGTMLTILDAGCAVVLAEDALWSASSDGLHFTLNRLNTRYGGLVSALRVADIITGNLTI